MSLTLKLELSEEVNTLNTGVVSISYWFRNTACNSSGLLVFLLTEKMEELSFLSRSYVTAKRIAGRKESVGCSFSKA